MSTPPTAGPTTIDRAMVVVWRVTAAVTSARSTSAGRAARRAGQSTPWNPALAAAQTNSTQTCGWSSEALTARPPTATAMAVWVRVRTRLRSQASARVPPHSAPASRGTSPVNPRRPTIKVEWVRWNVWYARATRVSWLPIAEIVWPVQRRRNWREWRRGETSAKRVATGKS